MHHAYAIIAMLGITFLIFHPLFFGKKMKQSEIQNSHYTTEEFRKYEKQKGVVPLWSMRTYSGMPAYQIAMDYSNNLTTQIPRYISFGIPDPASTIFRMMLLFYFLMIVIGVSPLLGITGAIAFAFSGYYIDALQAGHMWKLSAISYFPAITAAFILIARNKYLTGGSLLALFLSLEIGSKHPQMTYYFTIFACIIITVYLFHLIRKRLYQHLIKSLLVVSLAAILALGANATMIILNNDYLRYSARSGTELDLPNTNTRQNTTTYITAWSSTIVETLAFLIPNIKGGASEPLSIRFPERFNSDKLMMRAGKEKSYWGNQPFTGGPNYLGAITIWLFLFGLFSLKGFLKLSLFATFCIVTFLSWGKFFMPFTEFFIDYIPYYSKFRAVISIQTVLEFIVPLIGIYGLQIFYQQSSHNKQVWRNICYSGIIVIFLIGIAIITPYLESGLYSIEESWLNKSNGAKILNSTLLKEGYTSTEASIIMGETQKARFEILYRDICRSTTFIALFAIILLLYLRQKITKNLVIVLTCLLCCLDLLLFSSRIIDKNDFITPIENSTSKSISDNIIMKDTSYFRVFDYRMSTFSDSKASYFYNSIGGHCSAPLMIYNDIIQSSLLSDLKRAKLSSINKEFGTFIHQLNTKYFISHSDSAAILNHNACGPCWLADSLVYALKPKDAFTETSKGHSPNIAFVTDPATSQKKNRRFDISNSTCAVAKASNDTMIYKTNLKSNGFVIFSEIYYPSGWKAYIDNKESEIIRTNFAFRGLYVPAGEHIIKFIFKPELYSLGQNISIGSSTAILVIMIALIIISLLKNRND